MNCSNVNRKSCQRRNRQLLGETPNLDYVLPSLIWGCKLPVLCVSDGRNLLMTMWQKDKNTFSKLAKQQNRSLSACCGDGDRTTTRECRRPTTGDRRLWTLLEESATRHMSMKVDDLGLMPLAASLLTAHICVHLSYSREPP